MEDTTPKDVSRCSGRHWFAYRGWVGTSSPTCTRWGCDAPNPRYDRDRDPKAVVARTRTGRTLTSADLDALADEAERGYDVEKMRPRHG